MSGGHSVAVIPKPGHRPGSLSCERTKKTLDLRSFLEDLEAADPNGILRIPEPVGIDFDVTAVAMELEDRGRAPAILFEKVGDSPFRLSPTCSATAGATPRRSASRKRT